MNCFDMRLKQNSRVPKQFCRENNKATKCSISANVRFFHFHRYNKHMLSTKNKYTTIHTYCYCARHIFDTYPTLEVIYWTLTWNTMIFFVTV